MTGKKIGSFRELKVYQKAFTLQQDIFRLTKPFPKEEVFALTNQIRRSSRSIGANIAEAWQKRRYAAHFTSKLTGFDAQQAETQHWLDTSLACQYISPTKHALLMRRCREVGRVLGKMLAEPEKWCPTRR